MFEIGDKIYELKYSMKRLEMIEKVIKKSVMATLVETGGMLGIGDCKIFLAYGLYGEDEKYIPIKQGLEASEKLIEDDYNMVIMAILEKLQEDCPFLFPEG